jgi:hypothetical protein
MGSDGARTEIVSLKCTFTQAVLLVVLRRKDGASQRRCSMVSTDAQQPSLRLDFGSEHRIARRRLGAEIRFRP